MAHQIDVLSAEKCSCFSGCVRARIVVVKSDPDLDEKTPVITSYLSQKL